MAQSLEFHQGSYFGYVGQRQPMIEMKNPASGTRLRFFATMSGRYVTFVTLPAEGGVTSRPGLDREYAEALYQTALKKGYKVTHNEAGRG